MIIKNKRSGVLDQKKKYPKPKCSKHKEIFINLVIIVVFKKT